MFVRGMKKSRPEIQKSSENSIIFPKWQVKEIVAKSTTNCSFLKIFNLIFCLFRLTGIKVFSHATSMVHGSFNINAGKSLKSGLMVFIQNGCKYTIYVGMSTKTLLGIAMIFFKEDKTRCLAHSFAALLTVLFHVSVYRRRQEMLQMTDTLSY
ncbi:hypothetical protein TNCV_2824671 [Trichonephila clavipes]|nr:hypothetical protein TNCV_2824671 [Trichonephila clavipes]